MLIGCQEQSRSKETAEIRGIEIQPELHESDAKWKFSGSSSLDRRPASQQEPETTCRRKPQPETGTAVLIYVQRFLG